MAQRIEAGQASTLEGYVRIATALGLTPRFTLQPERAPAPGRAVDPVHSAMGEIEAAQFRNHRFDVRLDEPYQHYQFAGRADVIAHAPARRALLHIENRTRFPDIQGFAGALNAKRAYLAEDIAARFGVRGFTSVAHVVVALWSSEVLHSIRPPNRELQCPCPGSCRTHSARWWMGDPPSSGTSTSLVVFDPLPGERRSRRRWIGLEDALTAAPRYRDYAAALDALRTAGRA